ncbi:MAG: GAF domain-containing protein [Gemmatimonadota bacterium]|nr:GAF domain-containing protein [Gemmatimonadota bacterium]
MLDSREVVRELQEMRDDGHLSDALLRTAVRRIASSGERFSWTGVYLLNADANELWLHNYVGTPTEHARIPVGTGLCGTAVTEKKNQNVPDVSKSDNYLSCNPDVQSELVVLIRAGDEIFGQLDIDSEDTEAFTGEDESAVQAVADKLAEQLASERQ